jgi:hypothetical protein
MTDPTGVTALGKASCGVIRLVFAYVVPAQKEEKCHGFCCICRANVLVAMVFSLVFMGGNDLLGVVLRRCALLWHRAVWDVFQHHRGSHVRLRNDGRTCVADRCRFAWACYLRAKLAITLVK